MKNGKLGINYVMKKIEINKNSINRFKTLDDERRMMRQGKVKSIISSLEKRQHFKTPLIVNESNGRYRVIDGNHRIESIKSMIKKDPSFKIQIWAAVYRDLTRDQERKEYHTANIGTPENATDYLKQYFKTIPYGEEMLRKLPVTIYGDERNMSIKNLVGCHISSKEQRRFAGGYGVGGERTVQDFMEVNHEDIKIMKAFYLDMKEIFGDYFKGHTFYRTSPLSAFYRIWYDNKHIEREKFIEAFKEVFAKRQGEWNELTTHGGRSASLTFYRLSIERLNDYRKRLHFVSDVENLEKAEE